MNYNNLKECPDCGNYGEAFPENTITTKVGVIHYRCCNNCGYCAVNKEELLQVISEINEKILELEELSSENQNKIEDLESEITQLKTTISNLPIPMEDTIPNSEPCF